jgi:Holliday junction resolvase RusA-like endonuclease
MSTTFFIPIKPVAKARPRMGRFGMYTPKKTADFESIVKTMARVHHKGPPLEGPLGAILIFNFEKPKSSKNAVPMVRPDLDNYIKAILDALNEVVYKDDAQIVKILAEKKYSSLEGISISISRLSDAII